MTDAYANLWVPWSADRILFEDEDLVVVEKPANISTHAPDSGHDDDILSRVRAYLATRDKLAPTAVYLGVHDRIDRDVSGVLPFTKRKTANSGLAPQFEKRHVERRIVVAVTGWKGERDRPGANGMRVVDQVGPRVLLEYNGRDPVRSVREMIRAAGALVAGEIAGETNPVASQAMVHVASLTLLHPGTRASMTWQSPTPSRFERWLHAGSLLTDPSGMSDVLRTAAEQRHALAHAGTSTAFRLVNDAGDAFPGVTVDRYGDYALVQFYSPAANTAQDVVLDAVAQLGPRGIYAKYRPKQSNTLVDTRRDDLAPSRALRGSDAPDEFEVTENGLRYIARLGDGLSTGIFLDQRDNRRRVREMAPGKSVLNLFAYSGPFTVAAAAGGAGRTMSVDLSAGALDWAKRNLEINSLTGPQHGFAVGDVFGWLEGAKKRGDRFDLVLLDPPSYSTTRDGTRFSAASDYRALAALVFAVVAPGGQLLACSNHRGIVHAKFRRYLHEAAHDAGCTVAKMQDLAAPSDFPPAPGHEAHLKSVLVTTAR